MAFFKEFMTSCRKVIAILTAIVNVTKIQINYMALKFKVFHAWRLKYD